MRKTNVAQYGKNRLNSTPRVNRARRSANWLLAVACALGAAHALDATTDAFHSAIFFGEASAQSPAQLTIDKDTVMTGPIDDKITSVVFNGAYALALIEGQKLTPVFIAKDSGATLILSPSLRQTNEEWSILSNNPSWIGSLDVVTTNKLIVEGTAANPLGAYSETNLGSYATVNVYSGATLSIPELVSGAAAETKIGELTGIYFLETEKKFDPATVDVGRNRTLSVENGLEVDSDFGLAKTGEGTLQLRANGTKKPVKTTTANAGMQKTTVAEETGITAFKLGKLDVEEGTFSIVDGTAKVNDAVVTADSILVGSNATLDIQATKTIELGGSSADVVFCASDDSQINLYADANGHTSYVAPNFNTYMEVGKAQLNVLTSLAPQSAPVSMTVFAAETGQISYDASQIIVKDNLLGREYKVDAEASDASKIVLKLQDSKKLATIGGTPNERSTGDYFDRVIASGQYNDDERKFLSKIEDNSDSVDFATLTGELHASTVGFMYINNLATTQTLFEHMRNNSLVAYSGESSVAPMNYGDGRGYASGAPSGSAAYNQPGNYPVGSYPVGGSYDQGPLYYNTNTNSYAPGVVPISNTGAVGSAPAIDYSAGGVFNGETYNDSSYESSGNYNFGWTAPRRSTLVAMRGQEATYGDPGTLIYSAWADVLGGKPEAKIHKETYGYKGTQAGMLAGLDLFGSCDCRFGAYYGYQDNEIEQTLNLGKLRTKDHLLGLYHQYGDENVYTLMTIRGGYDNYKTSREANLLGIADTLNAKYDGFNLGGTWERGINMSSAPFTFSPYGALDYNFFFREKFTETSANNQFYALNVAKSMYHSVRGQLGARLALDMYPGNQQIRLVARAAYIHEFLNPMYGKTWADYAYLTSSGSSYAIYGNPMGRDWYLVGLDLDWTPIPALVLFLKGDYLGNKYTSDPFSSAGLKFRW